MYGDNFAVDSGERVTYRETKEKGGLVGIGFDAKMSGLVSKEATKEHLNLCLEDWKRKNPKSNSTEIRHEICSRVDLIVGGRTYTGYLYFKP